MKIKKIAETTSGLSVLAYQFGSAGPHVLILGGVHGDESEGVALAQALLQELLDSNPFSLQLTLVPQFNLEGILARTRANGSGVDLNRNLPTQDWSPIATQPKYQPGPRPLSEPENQGLVEWIRQHSPQLIISLHSYYPMLNVNGPCLPFAETWSAETGDKIVEDMGYPTPGSLGTYAGRELGIPTLTVEIERGLPTLEIIRKHLPALTATLKLAETIGAKHHVR